MADATDRVWRLLQVKPGCEARVVGELDAHTGQPRSGLRRLGVECYLPMERLNRWAGRQWKRLDRPLFRGYVFTCMTEAEMPLIHEIEGALKFVGSRAGPAKVPPVLVERVMADEAEGLYDQTRDRAKPKPRHKTRVKRKGKVDAYALGDLVRAKAGTFAGFSARIVRLTNKRRCEVLFAHLEGTRFTDRVEVDVADLEPAEAEAQAA